MSQTIDPKAREVFRRLELPMYRIGEAVRMRRRRGVGIITACCKWIMQPTNTYFTTSYNIEFLNGKVREEYEGDLRLASLKEEIAFQNKAAKQYTMWGYTT